MPKPTPEDQSTANAIRARAIEQATSPPDMEGIRQMTSFQPVSYANRRDQTQETRETEPATETGIDLATTPNANTQPMGDVPPTEPVSNALPHKGDALSPWHTETEDGPDSAIDAFQSRQTGDVPPTSSPESPAESSEPHTHTRDLSPLAVTNRLRKEGRWNEVEPIRDQMMRECKKRLPDKELRQAWVYSELDRMYPPVQAKPAAVDTGFVGTKGLREGLSDTYPKLGSAEGSDSGSIQGLNELPKGWPELAMNASLGADVGWVQANRLRVVEERPGKATLVKLEQALAPAPSWAALGWLETSIRSYAKYVDVASKVSGGQDDEGAVMRRERKSVDEVKALLREMEEAEGTCERCGRPR
jgi:hypothetical protein